MKLSESEALGGLTSPLAFKIFLDRYAKKDPMRAFQVGDYAIITSHDDPKWPVRMAGQVIATDGKTITLQSIEGPETATVPIQAADRPIETTLDQAAQRIAHAVAAVEPEPVRADVEARFRAEIAARRLVPGGRIWAGAGVEEKLTWYNCFVIPNPKDSRHGIVKTLDQMIEIMSRGGGVGINVSSLRPRHAIVRGVNGRSSGAVSWMDLYSRATGLVEQGGSRRGALMLQLADWHPDLLRFIDAKRKAGMVENANISVRVSDAFMAAVKADAPWDLVFPDTSDPDYDELWDGDLDAWRKAGKPIVVYQTLPAREIWSRIIESAWASAEPGVVFSGRHEADSNSQLFNPLIATNPCVTGETLVSTADGLIPVRALVPRGSFAVAVDDRMGGGRKDGVIAFPTGVKPVYRLMTREGFEVRLTADHRVRTERGWVEAKDLRAGDKIHVMHGVGGFGTEGSYDLGVSLGSLVGAADDDALALVPDLEACALAPLRAVVSARQQRGSAERNLNPSDDALAGGFATPVGGGMREHLALFGLAEDRWRVPDTVLRGTRDAQIGFLRGVFGAIGEVEDGKDAPRAVALRAPSFRFLQDVQRLLLNLGVYSRICPGYASCDAEAAGGEPEARARQGGGSQGHTLRVTAYAMHVFAQTVGFLEPVKARQLAAALANDLPEPNGEDFTATFEALVPDGEEVVYDLTVPEVHAFAANGLIVHNCAEEPLPAWGVCTLGHVNLAACVTDGRLDRAKVMDAVRAGVRFLDDVVDATPYFIEANRENQMRERRIGLGTMGLAEVLLYERIRYGSEEAVRFTDALYRDIAITAYDESIRLAEEKGAFPAWDPAILDTEAFVARLARNEPEIGKRLRAHGMRNVTVLTQAPTGTIGSMMDTSTGIEPYYALTYTRRSRLGTGTQYVRPAQDWMDAHPGEPLPEYFVGAMDLTPEEHIRMQAAVQRWTDSSISKTANAPSDYTIDETRQLYELAYDLGCKGVTIYRDKSRSEQVLSTDMPTTGTQTVQGPVLAPRPRRMRGECFLIPTHFGNLTLDVHEDPKTGEPVEIIASAGTAGSDLMADAVALGMAASVLLRLNSAVPKEERLRILIDKFRNIGGSRNGTGGLGAAASLAQALARGLEQYLEGSAAEGEAAATEALTADPAPSGPAATTHGRSAEFDLCPACGSASVEMSEGCRTCHACGWSKCS